MYIYPFGETIAYDDPKHLYMLEQGYKIFCGVMQKPYIEFNHNFVFMQRRTIDGIAFREHTLDDLIDMTGVVEWEVRPDRGYSEYGPSQDLMVDKGDTIMTEVESELTQESMGNPNFPKGTPAATKDPSATPDTRGLEHASDGSSESDSEDDLISEVSNE